MTHHFIEDQAVFVSCLLAPAPKTGSFAVLKPEKPQNTPVFPGADLAPAA